MYEMHIDTGQNARYNTVYQLKKTMTKALNSLYVDFGAFLFWKCHCHNSTYSL